MLCIHKTDEIIEECFDSVLQRHKKGLEELMKGNEFVFDSIDLLHYKFHKISWNLGGSFIDSPKWLKQ